MALIMRGTTSNVFTDITINDQILFDDWELEQNTISGNFDINTNGTNVITLTQSGLVGIGVAVPTIDLAIGDDDTGLNVPSGNNLALYSGGGETMRLDENGFVGIGIANPLEILSISSSNASGNNHLHIEETNSGGNPAIKLTNSNSNFGRIRMLNITPVLQLLSNNTNGEMSFEVDGTERLRLVGADATIKMNAEVCIGADTTPAITLAIVDNNTGIDWISEDIIAIKTNGAERIRFNAGSNGQIQMTVGTSNFDLTQSNASDGSQAMSVRRVRNNIDSRYIQFFKNTSTTVGALDDVSGTFSVVDLSDQRLKKNIVNYDGGYENIKNISARCFDWNTDITDNSSCRGFIAQELMTAIPSCVGLPTQHTPEDPIEYFTMSRTALIPELWSCCKTLISKVEELESKVETLENP